MKNYINSFEEFLNEAEKFKATKDFEDFLEEIDGMDERSIKLKMGKDYIDTPGSYRDEAGDYDNDITEYMIANMGRKEFEKLKAYWETNIKESAANESKKAECVYMAPRGRGSLQKYDKKTATILSDDGDSVTIKFPDGKTLTEYTAKDGLSGTEFWGIIIERSGIIWVTARGSTTRFDPSIPLPNPDAFTVFTPADGLNCCVQSMFQDISGRMWWGTGQGLYRFDGKRFYQVKQNGPW